MDAMPDAQESAGIAGLSQEIAPMVADEAEGVEVAPAKGGKSDAADPQGETPSPLPFGLANALRAVQGQRKVSLHLPPGLARRTAAPAQPAAEGTEPAPNHDSVPVDAAEMPVPVVGALAEG